MLLLIYISVSVGHIPEQYIVTSTISGPHRHRYEDILGRYSLTATKYKHIESLIYKHDGDDGERSYYLLNTTDGWVIGDTESKILKTTIISHVAPKTGWNFKVKASNGDIWINDSNIEVSVLKGNG